MRNLGFFGFLILFFVFGLSSISAQERFPTAFFFASHCKLVDNGANVRAESSTSSDIITLTGNAWVLSSIISLDYMWYLVGDNDGNLGFIRSDVAQTEGECSDIPLGGYAASMYLPSAKGIFHLYIYGIYGDDIPSAVGYLFCMSDECRFVDETDMIIPDSLGLLNIWTDWSESNFCFGDCTVWEGYENCAIQFLDIILYPAECQELNHEEDDILIFEFDFFENIADVSQFDITACRFVYVLDDVSWRALISWGAVCDMTEGTLIVFSQTYVGPAVEQFNERFVRYVNDFDTDVEFVDDIVIEARVAEVFSYDEDVWANHLADTVLHLPEDSTPEECTAIFVGDESEFFFSIVEGEIFLGDYIWNNVNIEDCAESIQIGLDEPIIETINNLVPRSKRMRENANVSR